ncbi:hypothetical protein SAMN06298216_3717 [Spirosomataceae bacterium TFI 002]|nr:hypothetical protein SAMN06298216_3717 [Spirosomataceae bacterium TFI 002]
MHYLIISLSVVAFGTIFGWFKFSSTIFIVMRDNTQSVLLKTLLVLSYAYPFLLAFSVYQSWGDMENGNYREAIYYCLTPLTVFIFGWLSTKFLLKKNR